MTNRWGIAMPARGGWATRIRPRRGWATRPNPTNPTPSRSWRDRIGFTVHALHDQYSVADTNAILDKAVSVGCTWVRDEFIMATHNPAAGVFDWTLSDRFMTAAAQRRLKVFGLVDYGVQWSSGQADTQYPPQAVHYQAYCQAIGARYGRSGTFWAANPRLPYVPLAGVELWNEPWLGMHWKPNPDPAAYCALVRAGVTGFRAADPSIQCLMAVDSQQYNLDHSLAGNWLRNVFTADPTIDQVVDGYVVHLYNSPKQLGPYDFSAVSGPSSIERYLTTIDDLTQLGKRNPTNVWVTDVGWTTDTTDVLPDGTTGISKAQAAQNYLDLCARAMQEWSVPRMFLFYLAPYTETPPDPGGFGMLNADWSDQQSVVNVRNYLAGP